MLRILILLLDSLPNLGGSNSNDWIGMSVVVRWPTEDLDSEYAFFELVGLSGQGT